MYNKFNYLDNKSLVLVTLISMIDRISRCTAASATFHLNNTHET